MKNQRSGVETSSSSKALEVPVPADSPAKVKTGVSRSLSYVKPAIKVYVACTRDAPTIYYGARSHHGIDCLLPPPDSTQPQQFMRGFSRGYQPIGHDDPIIRYRGRVFSWCNEWSLKLEHLLQTTSEFAIEKGIEKAKSNLETLVDLYSDDIPAPRYDMREAKMIAKAREKVILSTKWVTAADITELAGYQSSNKSAGAAKWKASNKIFSVRYRSEDLYPIYSLDKNNEYRPTTGLKPILDLFRDVKDNWGIAYWFAGANGFLGGKRPQELLQENPALVLEAAKDELKGVTHG